MQLDFVAPPQTTTCLRLALSSVSPSNAMGINPLQFGGTNFSMGIYKIAVLSISVFLDHEAK